MRKIHFSLSLAIIASCAMGACTLKELDDTIYLCGDSQKNCTTRDPYWLNGECVNGDCIATECKVGAYPYQGKCIQDTVEACGSPNNNCYENNQKCSLGKCVDACPNSETDCSDACKDLTKDPENCGSCGNICEKDDHGETTCQNSKCQLKCNDGYKKAYNSALDKLTCQKIEDSIVQQPACIEKGTCTCDTHSQTECIPVCNEEYQGEDCSECKIGWHQNDGLCEEDTIEHCGERRLKCLVDHGTAKCENGECMIEYCDDEYIIHENECILQNTNPPQDPECTSDNDCTIDNGEGTCDAAEGKCKYTCNEGYTLDGSTCVLNTNPPQKPECTTNDDCTIAHGTGTCNLSNGKCDYICDKLYKYDESTHLCVTTLVESDCIKDSDCNKINGASGTCNKGLCSYECPSNYHINQAKDACVPDSPTECGDIRENCVDSCLKGLKDSSKAIGICNSGLCQCGQCDEGSIANADHTKCEKDISTPTCSAKNCVTANAGWKQAVCEDDQCKATECETGYHIYNDQKKGSKDICELDTVERCGDPYVDCVSSMAGWLKGKCESGKCVATKCDLAYTLDTTTGECSDRCKPQFKFKYYCELKDKCCSKENCEGICELDYKPSLCLINQTDCDGDGRYCCDDPADCNSESTKQTKCESSLDVPED